MTVEQVVAVANRVWAPYALDVCEVAWFSIYEVAQRLTDRFDDGREQPRVFIAGDACHTHSAKAGQGMNVSMQDAFNLGWKLAAVLERRSGPELLATYSAERQPIAQELIDFDREWSAMLAGRPRPGQTEPPAPREVQDYFVRQGRYTAGVATRYRPSLLTGTSEFERLARGLAVGTRFHSAPVIRVADARRMQLGHVATADGRWRLYAFADAGAERLLELVHWLADDPASPVVRYTPAGGDVDAVLDVRAVLQAPHREIAFETLPRLLRPRAGRYGLTDYEKVFTAALGGEPELHELRGVDREQGCVAIVRPDQFIAEVLPLDAFRAISAYFKPLLLAAQPAAR
jgi:phenol 2-monooxygenase